jgi:AraC-like DNA-binding protein
VEPAHLSDDVLLRYAAEMWESSEFAAAREHLGRCTSCTSRLDGYQIVAAALRQPPTWTGRDDLAGRRSRSRLHRLEERLAREDAEAAEALAGKLDTPFIFEYTNLLRKKHLHTGGVVRHLSRAANLKSDDEPLFAFGLAQTAVAIATALPDDHYPQEGINELRGRAWIEYSTVCRQLGRTGEALDALDRAHAAYERLPMAEPGINLTHFARAILFWRLGRHTTALNLVRQSIAVFARYGDTAKEFDARQVEAVILHRQGDVRAARNSYESLYREGVRRGDGEMVARAAQNVGSLLLEEGRLKPAERYFEAAARLLEGLQLRGRAARAKWGLGLVALAEGDLEAAESRLRDVHTEMLALGMDRDAGDVRGDLARTLVALGRPKEADMIALDQDTWHGPEANASSPTLAERNRYDRAIDLYLRRCFSSGSVVRASELSDLLEANRAHVSRTIRSLYGRPLREVLRERQFAYATELLVSTRTPPSEVGRVAGFGHHSTFFRVFRLKFGMTPVEYREKRTNRDSMQQRKSQ